MVREQRDCREEQDCRYARRVTHLPVRCASLFSFSEQMNSIRSVLSIICWCTLTVNGFVYWEGSSTVTSMSSFPYVGRRNFSVTFPASVSGLPLTSSQTSSRKPLVSTTSVSPSQCPAE